MFNPVFGKIYSKFEGNIRWERIWKLAQVDFKKRYYNDKLGILWTMLNPLIQIAIFYFVFKYIRDSTEDNFVFFLYLGIISFGLFTSNASKGLTIIRSKYYLIENIQFNKLDIFWALGFTSLLSALIDFAIYSIVASYFGAIYNIQSLWLCALVLQLTFIGLGVAMILATIKFYLEDIRNIWSLISFALFWVSGIFFSGEVILEHVPSLLYINPLIGILVNVRHVFLYGDSINMFYLCVNTSQALIILLAGILSISRSWHLASENL